MSAYILFDNLMVNDEVNFEEYKNTVFPIVEKYHGKYKVLAGRNRVVEGDYQPTELVMIEFPSYELAQNWCDSEEYSSIRNLRLDSTTSNGIIIEGLD
jgi:uncharacterized protein (DUF1330 family)